MLVWTYMAKCMYSESVFALCTPDRLRSSLPAAPRLTATTNAADTGENKHGCQQYARFLSVMSLFFRSPATSPDAAIFVFISMSHCFHLPTQLPHSHVTSHAHALPLAPRDALSVYSFCSSSFESSILPPRLLPPPCCDVHVCKHFLPSLPLVFSPAGPKHVNHTLQMQIFPLCQRRPPVEREFTQIQ